MCLTKRFAPEVYYGAADGELSLDWKDREGDRPLLRFPSTATIASAPLRFYLQKVSGRDRDVSTWLDRLQDLHGPDRLKFTPPRNLLGGLGPIGDDARLLAHDGTEFPGGPADEAIRGLDRRVVPLGGKAHRARIHCLDDSLIPDQLAADGAPAAGMRKLWLITPLVLGVTEWPAGVACTATDRAVPVGGFDMARRAPKPLRQDLPAGTVLTINGLAPSEALAALGGEAWNDDRRAGYGVALAGKGTEHP